jgi:hypothetical protein
MVHRIFSADPVVRLSSKDLVEKFKAFGLSCSIEQVNLLCLRYDGDEDGKLNFWELANIFES